MPRRVVVLSLQTVKNLDAISLLILRVSADDVDIQTGKYLCLYESLACSVAMKRCVTAALADVESTIFALTKEALHKKPFARGVSDADHAHLCNPSRSRSAASRAETSPTDFLRSALVRRRPRPGDRRRVPTPAHNSSAAGFDVVISAKIRQPCREI